MTESALNSYLIPQDAPIGTDSPIVPGYTFQTQNERGIIGKFFAGTAIIGDAQIGTITFNKIIGGTAVLGGTVNGVLSVKNSSGSEIVRADNTGLTINSGSITINNSNGTAVIDGFGVNSTNVFPFLNVSGSGTQGVTGTTYTDLTGLTLTFTTSRSQSIFASFVTLAGGLSGSLSSTSPAPNTANIALILDGTNESGVVCASRITQDQFPSPSTILYTLTYASYQNVFQVGAGTHTIKLQMQSSDTNTAKVSLGATSLTVFKLGA